MGCNNCLSNLKEEEILSEYNSGNNSPKRKNNKNNALIKKNITLIPKRNTMEENDKFFSSLSSSKNNQKSDLFCLEILDEINKYRIRHGVDELTFDKNITKISQKYAEKCARENELELSDNKYNNEELGEIIFCCKDKLTPKDIVDIWYNQGSENYDYNKEPESPNDFTQLIWKNSKLFGLGYTLTKENKYYIVANFFPEGNIKGQFLKNVYPKITHSEANSFYSINTKFLEEIFNSHNKLRIKHNSPPLILNPSLSTLAQEEAEKMAENKEIKIDSNNKLYGKNYFFSENNSSGEEVTSFWYKGKNKYNFRKELKNKDEMINNFTQLIWKNTKEVGFGFTNDDKGNFYVVAYYFPSGNIKGEYKKNVLPDK